MLWLRSMLQPVEWSTDCGHSMAVSPNNRRLNMWPMHGQLTYSGTNVNHQLEIQGLHNFVWSTTVLLIGIKLTETYQLLEMDVSQRKGKVYWPLDNKQYMFQKNDAAAGMMQPLAGIMLRFILRVTWNHSFAAESPPPFPTVSSQQTHSWASMICTSLSKCHLSSSV